MSLARPRSDENLSPAATITAKAARFVSGTKPGASPAREMQLNLAATFDEAAQSRWSPRQTLFFIVTTCGAFWAAVILAIRHWLG